ncbi:MAG TPA: response regulator [Elusimicrobiota bacterium]|nr:response regulator [Elusimicrobiota bacterium]
MTPEKDRPQTVLVVDDDPPMNELVKLVLETRGYRVLAVSDGKVAVETIRSRRPDLVVLDVMLPEISGLEICEMVKGDPEFKDVKVVMLSAKSLNVDKLRARGKGADAYLTKPVRLAELLDTVNGLLVPSGIPGAKP